MAWSDVPGIDEIGVDFLGRKGVKCLVRRRGPMVFVAKVSVSWS